MIHDIISNEKNHKNDRFLQINGRKTSFKNVTMVTKMLHVYISVTVPVELKSGDWHKKPPAGGFLGWFFAVYRL